MDDLFLVLILGKCWQGLLRGARNESWLLEPRHSGFLDSRIYSRTCVQVIYDSLFPDNPRAIRSLDIEDWDAFCSPWAHDRFLSKLYPSICFYCAQEGRRKVSIHLESVRTTHGYNMIPSVCITNGNSTKARILFFPHCMVCWSSSPLDPRLQPGSGKSAPFPSSGEGSGDFCTGKWLPSLYETEGKCSGTFAVSRAGLGRQPARRNDSFRCKFLAVTL